MTQPNDYVVQTVFGLARPNETDATHPPEPDTPFQDPNMPASGFYPAALTPNGMLIVAGWNDDSSDIELGVIDPVKGTDTSKGAFPDEGRFFPVKTEVTQATTTTLKIDSPDAARPHALVRLTGDEYLMIATDPESGANATESDLNSQFLYRLRLTLPADLTKPAPNSIKVEVLGKEDLPALNLGQSSTHKIWGLTLGREVAPGKPLLYMGDWAGNIITLLPQ
jgi:hypothetical protein